MTSVVVICWNLLRWHRRCIVRARQEVPPGQGEIIVVDQASTDGTQAYLREALKLGLIDMLLLEEENRGAAVARNKAVQLAKHDRVLLLDGDIIMPRDWVRLANAYLDGHPAYAAISIHPAICTREESKEVGRLPELREVRETRTSCTNLGVYRKEFLRAVPFPEHAAFGQAGWGYEDTLQSSRAIAKGYKWVQVEDQNMKYLHPLSSSRAVLDATIGREENKRRTQARFELYKQEDARLREAMHP